LKFLDFLSILEKLQTLNVIGFDVVELSPVLDPSGRSSVFAAEVIRELMLNFIKKV